MHGEQVVENTLKLIFLHSVILKIESAKYNSSPIIVIGD
jgi:hypothetical protein